MSGETIQLNAALSIFEDNLEDIKQSLAENIIHDLSKLEPYPSSEDEEVKWIYKELDSIRRKEIVEQRNRVIKRIVAYQQYKYSPKIGGVTDEMIARAKETPLVELVQEHGIKVFKDGKALCPFHNERSPSFHINRKKNYFKCFGCSEGGDSITFYMKMNKVGFIDAVRQLNKQ